jgi:hypothetical protein
VRVECPVEYSNTSSKKNNHGPLASIVSPSLVAVERPGPGTLSVIDLLGSLRFVDVAFNAPVTSVAPLAKVIPYSLFATTWTPEQSQRRLATEEDLQRDFGSGRLVIGFPVRPPSSGVTPPEAEQPPGDQNSTSS